MTTGWKYWISMQPVWATRAKVEQRYQGLHQRQIQSDLQLMSKSDVNGHNTNEVYSWLKQRAGDTSNIGWNFARIYLIDRSGTKVQQFDGKNPSDLIGNIEELAENEL